MHLRVQCPRPLGHAIPMLALLPRFILRPRACRLTSQLDPRLIEHRWHLDRLQCIHRSIDPTSLLPERRWENAQKACNGCDLVLCPIEILSQAKENFRMKIANEPLVVLLKPQGLRTVSLHHKHSQRIMPNQSRPRFHECLANQRSQKGGPHLQNVTWHQRQILLLLK